MYKVSDFQIEVYSQPEKHFEAELYKKQRTNAVFYLTNCLHKRRLKLLAEIIKNISIENNNKKLIMINLGSGEGELEGQIKSITNLYKIGTDVSSEALKVGMKKKLFNRAISVDIEKDLDKIKSLPKADIVIAGEILEHLKHPGVFIKENVKPLISKGGYFIGSVPNMAQLFDVIGLLTGRGESYQTTRPLTDITSGHISFFSIHSLLKTLKYAGYKEIVIKGNGVRIKKKGDKNLFFLSKLPFFINFSDRLIFNCRKV